MFNRDSGFVKTLRTQSNRRFEFQFDVIHSNGFSKFLVSVLEEGKRITFFHMQKKSGDWKIINAPKVADEFLQLEESLSLVIKQHEY